MTTRKQIVANQQNALVSTGPKSAAGKAIVASNALKLGVYALRPVVDEMESVAEWEEFRAGIVADLAPLGPFEQALAERIAGCLWRLRRVTSYEAAVIESNRKDWLYHKAPEDESIRKMMLEETETLKEMHSDVRTWKAMLRDWEGVAAFVEQLQAVDASDSVDGNELHLHLLAILTELLPEHDELEAVEILEAAKFQKAAGLPVRSKTGADPWKWQGWTIGHARRAVAHVMTYDDERRSLEVLIQKTLEESRRELAVAEAEEKERGAELFGRHERITAAKAMPDENVTGKIARYESHLSRQMTHALHELQRFQASRAGSAFLPAVVDVTIHGPSDEG